MSARHLLGFLLCGVALWGLAPARGYAANAIDGGTATADSLNTGTGTATSIGNSAGTTVNGPATINGALTQTGNTSINTSAGTTTASSSLANSGGAGILADSNGKLTSGTLAETTAALTVTNGLGNTHGFVVTEHAAVVSGGTTSNSMTINDAGASFANSDTGAPIKVTGVADGTSRYDAVNYGQISGLETAISNLDSKVDTLHKNMAGGIASVAAMSALPALEKGKKYAIGMGTGYFDSQAGLAFGFTGRFNKRVVGKVGLAVSPSSPESNAVANAGISYAW